VFEAEPNEFRWSFDRDGGDAEIRLVEDPDGIGESGVLIWSGRYPVRVVAEAVLNGLDRELSRVGEAHYWERRRSPFPHVLVETIRDQLAGER
jgi:hypothetical protein